MGEGDFKKPTRAQRVGVSKRRVRAQGFVDFHYGSARGDIDIGRRLDRLYNPCACTRIKNRADGGQVHEDDVSKNVLGVYRDANGCKQSV